MTAWAMACVKKPLGSVTALEDSQVLRVTVPITHATPRIAMDTVDATLQRRDVCVSSVMEVLIVPGCHALAIVEVKASATPKLGNVHATLA